MRRTIAPLLLTAALATTAAHAGEMAAALHEHRWADAAAAVAGAADPVAAKLVLYERLLTPGAASAVEIAAFLAGNPAWPNAAALARRGADALAAEPDSAAVRELCARNRPQQPAALLRCADAQAEAGSLPAAAAFAADAWVAGITDPVQEGAFLRQWGAGLSDADQWRRFDRLAWSDSAAPTGPAPP